MPLHTLLQIDGWDPVAGAPVTLYAASHDHPAVCHASGGTWWPAIVKLPTLRYDFFDGAFGTAIEAPTSSLTLNTAPWPNFGRLSLADARLRIWTGDATVAAPVWTLRFDGRVATQPKLSGMVADIDFGVDDRWLDGSLLATYAGTTGIEGPLDLKGQAKPIALGAPRYIPGKLIDSVNSVFQLSAYAPIRAVEASLERLVRFGAPTGDYAGYAELVAADVKAGTWATSLAAGLVRFGAPTNGQIAFLVQGEVSSGTWSRTPGQIIRRLAERAGGGGKIDTAALAALDAARPYPLSIYLEEQTTAREQIQSIAASVNAVALVTWLGLLTALPVGMGAPALTLAADGSALPPVTDVQQIDISAPFKSIGMQAARAWQVHSLNDIAFTAELLPLGLFSPTTVYREGNIVSLADGSEWIYVATTPAAGHVPPSGTTGDAWWYQRTPPVNAVAADGTPLATLIANAQAIASGKARVIARSTPPTADESSEGDLWLDTANGNLLYRRAAGSGRLAVGGNRLTFGGNALIVRPWVLASDDRINQSLAGVADALSRIGVIQSDGWLSAGEKPDVIRQRKAVDAEYPELLAKAQAQGLVVTAYQAAYAALTAYLDALSPSYADTSTDTPIVAATFSQRWTDYYLARVQLTNASADLTAANQVTVTLEQSIEVPADYTGAIAANVLPRFVSPAVKRGGTSITTGAGTSYALSNWTGGCTSANTVVDNTPGSPTKGQVSLQPGWSASGAVDLSIYANNVLVGTWRITATKKLGAPPSGGGTGSSNYGKSGSFSAAGKAVSSATYAEVARISNLAKGAGETIRATFSASYDLSLQIGVSGTRTMLAKWQYAPAGSTTWTDFAAAVTGTAAGYIKHNSTGTNPANPYQEIPVFGDDDMLWEIYPGAITCNQQVSPPDGNYDIRLVACINSASYNAALTISDGPGSVAIGV